MNFEKRTLSTIRDGIAAGTISATTLTQEHLQRVRTHDQVPGEEINSFLSLSEDRALAQAERVDALAKAGDPLPLLAGVPMGVKDLLAMQGAPTTAGSAILKGYHPPYDATAVAKAGGSGCRAAGQVQLRPVRHGVVERELGVWAGTQSACAGPRSGRVVGRIGGGGGGRLLRGIVGD